jgi:transcription factor TGA
MVTTDDYSYKPGLAAAPAAAAAPPPSFQQHHPLPLQLHGGDGGGGGGDHDKVLLLRPPLCPLAPGLPHQCVQCTTAQHSTAQRSATPSSFPGTACTRP